VHFFSVYGENTAQKWQEFWLFANAVCADNQYEEVVKMAMSLFEFIELHLKNSTV
jgi:heme oxygenase